MLTGILTGIILVQAVVFWKYQRQVKDICRQLSFLKEKDSNMLLAGEVHIGHLGQLMDILNEYIIKQRKRNKAYMDKEKTMADTYTCLSHDIRTPLTSLDGYFQLLGSCETQEEQDRYITIIQERIQSLKRMLEELFTFAKLKNDSYTLELSPCCVNKIVKETIFSYYDEWTSKNIVPQIAISEERMYIQGNKQALHRMLQNIIKNGLDHGKKSIDISVQPREDQVELVVKNYVENVQDIAVSKVFEQFYKADAARARQSNGLGLFIAREFVRRMKGQIKAEIVDHEFAIRITFPRCPDGEKD